MVRLAGTEPDVFAAAGCARFRVFAHLALWACAILRREAVEVIRFGWLVLRSASEPFNDSIAEIA